MNRRSFLAATASVASTSWLKANGLLMPDTASGVFTHSSFADQMKADGEPIYTYVLQQTGEPLESQASGTQLGKAIFRGGKSDYHGTKESYDDVIASGCFQGLINRGGPRGPNIGMVCFRKGGGGSTIGASSDCTPSMSFAT
jgi:hypothetical protein